MENEKDFKERIKKLLSPHFKCKFEEIPGKHLSGANVFIDALITPLPVLKAQWANPDIVFGIEFKAPKELDRERNRAKLIRQCFDYSHTEFFISEKTGWKNIPVLMCPMPITKDISLIKELLHVLNQFNIGTLSFNYKTELEIIFAAKHVIWNENDGVREGNRWKFEHKYGSQ